MSNNLWNLIRLNMSEVKKSERKKMMKKKHIMLE
jgi:hypothetical protein